MLPEKERLMLKIFHDYYVRNMSQAEIAVRHFISRQKVQRYLDQGRKQSIVEVRIKFPERMHGTLESELEDKYGLQEVIVVDADAGYGQAMLRRSIAEFASEYFLRVLSKSPVVSVCWSTFIAEMLDRSIHKAAVLREKPTNIDIVQCLGVTVDADPGLTVFDSPRRLAGALGARFHMLMAPSITASAKAYRVLMDDPQIASVLALARRSQAGFFGIGSVDGDSNLMRSIAMIMPELVVKLKKLGVIGDMNGRFFDLYGRPVVSEMDERLIGLSLDDVRELPLAVGVTGGHSKFYALRAAIMGKLVNAVIIDFNNAKQLIEDMLPVPDALD